MIEIFEKEGRDAAIKYWNEASGYLGEKNHNAIRDDNRKHKSYSNFLQVEEEIINNNNGSDEYKKAFENGKKNIENDRVLFI